MGEEIWGSKELYEIISELKRSGLFTSINTIELIDEESVKVVKIKATVLDGSILYVTELHTPDYEKYSYHWQKHDGQLIIRWDNSPHWEKLKTFPHHRHEERSVFPSHRVEIKEVIEVIKGRVILS